MATKKPSKTKPKGTLAPGAPDPADVAGFKITPIPDGLDPSGRLPLKQEPADNVTPQPKIIAATFAGAIVTIVVWLVHAYGHVDLPAEVVAALTTLVAGGAGYFVSNK